MGAQSAKELRTNRTFMLAAAAHCHPSEVLWYASSKLRGEMYADRRFVQRLVEHTGLNGLAGASAELRNDRAFLFKLAEARPLVELLAYIGDDLRGDREFILKALGDCGVGALAHASNELRADRNFMLQVATKHPLLDVLGHASAELRTQIASDRTFILNAVKENGAKALEYGSAVLRADLGFMLEVATLLPHAAEAWGYASEELRAEMLDEI